MAADIGELENRLFTGNVDVAQEVKYTAFVSLSPQHTQIHTMT